MEARYNALIAQSVTSASRAAATSQSGIYFRPRILKDRAERCASAVRERVQPALAIVCDETPDGHGLHRMGENADRGVVNAGRGTEQNHSVLCAENSSSGFAIARASSDLWDFCNARQMFSPSHIAGRISRFNVTRIQQYSGGEE